jgi:serine/threonine-protein kinase
LTKNWRPEPEDPEGHAALPPRAIERPHDDVYDTLAASPSSMARSTARQRGLPVEVGEVINGKYRVDGILGEGGVGIVVVAQHLELDEKVALKFLKPNALGDLGLVARFAREAKAAVSIKSEHVARILDVGTMGPARIPFIVMEYLDGTDLRTAGKTRGVFSTADTAEYSLHVCEALAMAHANGIVHRDIKPDNLFLTTNPQMPSLKSVKVLDFGISKAALTSSAFQQDLPAIQTVHLMGTPLYMSPEQVRLTSEADARSDIWSLGMVMYEMLLGSTAFKGASITELCAAILERPIVPIREKRPDVPEELARAIEKCLAKDPAARFQNVGDLAIALLPFAPKRARSCAERAIGVLQTAGIIAPEVNIESILPPPPTVSTPALDPQSPAATLGSFTLQAVGSSSQSGPVVAPRNGRSTLMLVGGAAFLATLVGVAIVVRGAAPTATPPSGVTAAATGREVAPESSARAAVSPPSTAATPTLPIARSAQPSPVVPVQAAAAPAAEAEAPNAPPTTGSTPPAGPAVAPHSKHVGRPTAKPAASSHGAEPDLGY